MISPVGINSTPNRPKTGNMSPTRQIISQVLPLHTNSDVVSKDDKTSHPNTIKELALESKTLQAEIRKLFEDYRDINQEIKSDIDDFCRIYENNTSTDNTSLHEDGQE